MFTVSKIADDCKPCKKKKIVSNEKKRPGLLTTLLLILLPKCPFCVLAFSSTVVLCGKAGGPYELIHNSSSTVFVTSFFCFLVLISILFNYRDARTKYALLLVATGCLLIMCSVCIGGGFLLYYSGVFLLFIGVWLNARYPDKNTPKHIIDYQGEKVYFCGDGCKEKSEAEPSRYMIKA